jgi:magnesium transporter
MIVAPGCIPSVSRSVRGPSDRSGIIRSVEYLSQLISRPVLDAQGEQLGRISEMIAGASEPYPLVRAVQVRTEDGALFLPYTELTPKNDGRAFQLRSDLSTIQPYMPQPNDFSLVRDVLDKQIVDVHDYRVVRVNDIRLAEIPGTAELALLGVDIGLGGLIRRMGIEGAINGLQRLFGKGSEMSQFIKWDDIGSLPTHNAGEPIRLKFSHEKLAQLHPADIGQILNQMDPADRNEFLQDLDVETAAEALAEAEDDVQVQALQTLDEERAADILEEMPADEAADVLGDLDAARRRELLGHMEDEERGDVEELLEYGDETAGGMMTNEFVAISQEVTAAQTIDTIRRLSPDAETIYYIYVTDPDEHLTGVISLRDLIVAEPETQIFEFMIRKVVSVRCDAHLREVAHQFERYKLLALPVTDEDDKLVGIITVDDTLEQILPDNWRKRPTRRPDRNDDDA